MTDYALRLGEDEIARYRLMAELSRARETDVWARAGITTGARVADVGCGPGAMLPALSAEVGAEGSVEAIDGDDAAVATASALVEAAGLDNVTVRQSRAEETGLDAGAFDTVMTRHVLAHNGTTAQAIVEHVASLLKPGGCAFLVDIDMTAMRLRPDDPVVKLLMERYADFQVQRGGAIQVGLHLDELLVGAGLEVEVYQGIADVVTLPHGVRGPAWAARDAMVAAGVVSEREVAQWGEHFDAVEAAGTQITLFAPRYLAVGRRPG